MIENIFTTPIYAIHLDLNNDTLIDHAYFLSTQDKGVSKSNEGGFHSNDISLQDKDLQSLLKSITHYSQIFSEGLGLKGNRVVNQIWCNINGYGDFNKNHRHMNSCLSGVYYVQTPLKGGKIHFVREGNDLIDAYWYRYTEQYNTHNSIEFSVPPRAGLLLLFPSWLEHYVSPHYVNPHTHDEKRISYSFNVV